MKISYKNRLTESQAIFGPLHSSDAIFHSTIDDGNATLAYVDICGVNSKVLLLATTPTCKEE